MLICSISRIKNEEDIIETFIRYHLNFIDKMIIIEDYSSDETYNILQCLKKENLPIHIYRNSKKQTNQEDVINRAYNIAVNDFNADLVVTLDCDEFLVKKDKGNPRALLEKLGSYKYYKVLWRTYLPNLKKEQFSLENLEYIRDPKMEDMYKVIIPTDLKKLYDVKLKKGSHAIYDNNGKDIPLEILDDLRLVHVPIRSKGQFISKMVIGWLNNITTYYKYPGHSWHQNKVFQLLLKTNGKISDEQLIYYAKTYSSLISDNQKIKEVKKPFDISFCENLTCKYTHNQINDVKNILEFCENMALNYGKLNQTLKNINKEILNNTDNINENYLDLLEDAYSNVKKQLYFKENENIQLRNRLTTKNNHMKDIKNRVSIRGLLKYNTARLDIKNEGTSENSVEIIDISDKKSNYEFPSWFSDEKGSGLTLESSKGALRLQLKCIQEGTLHLNLLSMNYKINEKRIPIYINYTNLIINKETIFKSNKVASHDNKYEYIKKVENGEILDIYVSWEPISLLNSTEIEENIMDLSSLNKLKKYNTARIDIKNEGNSKNTIKVLENSDTFSITNYPSWFANEKGSGLSIESSKGELHLKLKCVQDGELNIKLLGIDYRIEGTRLPIYINFKKFMINNQTILNSNNILSHDDNYVYTKPYVQHGEIIDIYLSWEPI